jgi:hypothetical protein
MFSIIAPFRLKPESASFLNQFDGNTIRPFKKCNSQPGNICRGHEKGKALLGQIPTGGIDIVNRQPDMIVSISLLAGVTNRVFIFPGNSQIDRGAVKIERGAVGGSEFFSFGQGRRQVSDKKIDHLLKVPAYKVQMMKTVGHKNSPASIVLFGVSENCQDIRFSKRDDPESSRAAG